MKLCGWGEDAVLGVVRDFGDGLGCSVGGRGLRQVEAGDLQAVEEETGAARIDLATKGSLQADLLARLDCGGIDLSEIPGAELIELIVGEPAVVGFGLDYDEDYRNLRDVCVLSDS